MSAQRRRMKQAEHQREVERLMEERRQSYEAQRMQEAAEREIEERAERFRQEIIEREAMDIIQPDLRRCGGFTEGRRIAALIASAGLTLIPHAYGITHLHYAIATPGVPMAEYFPLPCWDALPTSDIEPIFLDEPEPVRGEVKLSEKPGLGVEVNEKIFD